MYFFQMLLHNFDQSKYVIVCLIKFSRWHSIVAGYKTTKIIISYLKENTRELVAKRNQIRKNVKFTDIPIEVNSFNSRQPDTDL